MDIRSSYATLGLGLVFTGVLLALLSYFVLLSIPLTALGISAVILSGVCFALARGMPMVSPEASAILFDSGLENISAIVEELGLQSKAVYLPSSLAGGKPKALLPLDSSTDFPRIERALPKRLIVQFGGNPKDMGVLLTTPGSGVAGRVSSVESASSGDLESSLELVLVGTVSLVDSVKVSLVESKVLVEISNPRMESKNMWVYEWLGSPLASIVASVVAEVLNKPVSIVKEEMGRAKRFIELKVVN
jgi:hypothetical protein